VQAAFGHDVRLIAPQFVKPPYLKSQKNDANDAEAIAEAVSRPNMRFVPKKSIEQQDLQALHRIRSRSNTPRIPPASAPPVPPFWGNEDDWIVVQSYPHRVLRQHIAHIEHDGCEPSRLQQEVRRPQSLIQPWPRLVGEFYFALC
jgi:hypothetical protein